MQKKMVCKGPPLHLAILSITSNGSIQFLPRFPPCGNAFRMQSLNPLKRVNSILTLNEKELKSELFDLSQSPQTGQFNSYPIGNDNGKTSFQCSLNPLKRVNSILTTLCKKGLFFCLCLNPLKRVNSILTGVYPDTEIVWKKGLNPLKRVNSILTKEKIKCQQKKE